MLTLLYVLGASFALCVVLTPLARQLALRYGLVDCPDAHRKLHGRPIPVAGGLAVLASTCAVLGLAFLAPHPLQTPLLADSPAKLGLLLGSLLLCGVGVLDDYRCLRGRHKLLGQIVAASVVIWFGVRVDHIEVFGWGLDLGLWAIPFTLVWLLGAINSLNLLDGMDGMLGCVGVIITLALAGMAVLSGHWAAACVAVALAGALLGFLCYNLPPATIFMGDAGSMVTGLVIGTLAIKSSLKAPATVALIAPLAVLTIPFLDTTAALLRRKLTGRSIYTTDRGHLHHCLLRHGFSRAVVLGVVSLCCLLTVGGALASLALKNELVAVCAAVAVVAVLVATRLFGYAEFLLVKKRLGHLLFSCLQTRGDGRSQQIEVHIQGTASWNALLETITVRAFDLNLQTIRVDVNAPALHEEYHAQWDRFDVEVEDALWHVEVPLVIAGRPIGRLQVSGYLDGEPLWGKVAALSKLIEDFDHAIPAAKAAGHANGAKGGGWKKRLAGTAFVEPSVEDGTVPV